MLCRLEACWGRQGALVATEVVELLHPVRVDVLFVIDIMAAASKLDHTVVPLAHPGVR